MKALWNDLKYSSQLEKYFFEHAPPVLFNNYNYKTQKAYLNMHLDYICEPHLNLSHSYWFEKDISNLNAKEIFKDNYREAYEVLIKLKRNTIDLTCFIRDHKDKTPVTDYIQYVEEKIQQKIIYGLFTYCDEAMYLPIHTDNSEIQHRRLHHVIHNGGIESIILYNFENSKYVECDSIKGNTGDVFWFDACRYPHNFKKPTSKRLHFIMSTEKECLL